MFRSQLVAIDPTSLAKLGTIVAETLFPDMFPWVAKLGNIRSEAQFASVKQNCFDLIPKHSIPCFQDAKFASAKYVSRAAN